MVRELWAEIQCQFAIRGVITSNPESRQHDRIACDMAILRQLGMLSAPPTSFRLGDLLRPPISALRREVAGDVQDQLRAVNHAGIDFILNVALLRGRKLMVHQHQVSL